MNAGLMVSDAVQALLALAVIGAPLLVAWWLLGRGDRAAARPRDRAADPAVDRSMDRTDGPRAGRPG
jgi:hypothetical protein